MYVNPNNLKDRRNWIYYHKYIPNHINWIYDPFASTVKPVCNDHLYDKVYYLRFIQ